MREAEDYVRSIIRYFVSRTAECDRFFPPKAEEVRKVERELHDCLYSDIVDEELSHLMDNQINAIGFGLLHWAPIDREHNDNYGDMLDRLARDLADLEEFQEELKERGV